jgi:ABC-2 type transport system ATP-binding protein
MSSPPVVKIAGITKQFNGLKAVDDVSLSIERGVIYGLLGPNGAGKTTTIRMMMRMMYPDSGTIEIFGGSLRLLNKDRIGYLPEERGLYTKMKVIDLLVFFGEIKSMSRAAARRAGLEWLERLNLADWAQRKIEELSKGMQQKLQFIATVLHEPDLVILDEPFSGLDPVNVNVLMDIILDFHRRDRTVIFSTHVMDQVEKLCHEICLIDKGCKVLDGKLAEIKRRYGRNTVTIRFDGDGSFLEKRPDVESASNYGNELYLRLKENADPKVILRDANEQLDIRKFEVAEPSIHDIFVDQVSG